MANYSLIAKSTLTAPLDDEDEKNKRAYGSKTDAYRVFEPLLGSSVGIGPPG